MPSCLLEVHKGGPLISVQQVSGALRLAQRVSALPAVAAAQGILLQQLGLFLSPSSQETEIRIDPGNELCLESPSDPQKMGVIAQNLGAWTHFLRVMETLG